MMLSTQLRIVYGCKQNNFQLQYAIYNMPQKQKPKFL